MGRINGHNTLSVIRTVEASGGGATLNLAYSLTPPSDTSKIWVKTGNQPNNVKVEANRNLVISNNENAKEWTSIDNLRGTKAYQYKDLKNMVKIGDNFYIAPTSLSNDMFMGISLEGNKIYKWNGIELTTLCELEIPQYTSQREYYFFDIWKYDDNNILVIYYNTYYRSYTTYFYYKFILININDGTYVNYSTLDSSSKIRYSCLFNGKIYSISRQTQTSFLLGIYDFINGNFNSQEISVDYNIWVSGLSCPVYYNGYLYFLSTVATTNNAFNRGVKTGLYRLNLTTLSIERLCDLPYLSYSGIYDYSIAKAKLSIYGDKIIIYNMCYNSTSNLNTVYSNEPVILFVDTNTFNIERFSIGKSYSGSFDCVDEETGNIYFIGGCLPDYDNSWTRFTHILSNIYELEENTLDLFYDTSSSNNINLINEETITVNAPINHAWLGDSNNIAQTIDMFYYKNGLWYGVNCLGWTQLKNATISANDMTMIVGQTVPQQINLDLTWANQDSNYSIRLSSSDTSIATTVLDIVSGNYVMQITGVSSGSATVTITVVDDYGTTFTKDIIITVEAEETNLA